MNKSLEATLIQQPELERNILARLVGLLPWVSNKYDYDELLNKIDSPDFIYTRYNSSDKAYIKFLCSLKTIYPESRILIEFPTYPYDKELLSPKGICFLLKDKIYRKQLKNYTDRIVVISNDENEIFGIPTIKTINGIDVSTIKKLDPIFHKDDEIHLIAVAMFQEYHGYERIIKGLAEYYNNSGIVNKRSVFLHMVGDGPEKNNYVQLVEKLRLKEKVIFYGSKIGDELDGIYNRADIAISSLGLYKLGINNLSALKTREYLAKGLPMVTGCNVDVLTNKFPYYIEFDNDSSAIKIERIVEFYDSIYSSADRNNVIDNIRKFAEENVDIRKVMQPLVEYINSDKG
jgi:hypothetical protein